MVIRKGTFRGILFSYGYFTFVRSIHLFTVGRHPWLLTLFSAGSISDHELMMSSDCQYVPTAFRRLLTTRRPPSRGLIWRHFRRWSFFTTDKSIWRADHDVTPTLCLCLMGFNPFLHRPQICLRTPVVSRLDTFALAGLVSAATGGCSLWKSDSFNGSIQATTLF